MNKFKIIILASTLILTTLFLTFKTRPVQSVECENIFNSNIYPAYRDQLIEISNTYHSQNIKLLSQILTKEPKNSLEARKQFESFLLKLRELIQSHREDESLKKFVSDLYLKTDLRASLIQFKKKFAQTNSIAALKKDPTLQPKKFPKLGEDQFLRGNLPYKLGQIKSETGAEVTLFRMGYPLDSFPGNLFSLSQPYPEMNLYWQQNRHLYVNLMRRHGKEGEASRSVEALEKIYPKLTVITLDKNSDFYHQNLSPTSESSQEFIAKFQSEMLKEKSNYFFSAKIDQKQLRTVIKNVMHTVLSKFFQDREVLTQSERQSFIEITYVQLIKAITDTANFKSINISCHQCMDRGPSTYLLLLLSQKDISYQIAEKLMIANPIAIHARGPNRDKLMRLKIAYDYLDLDKKLALNSQPG